MGPADCAATYGKAFSASDEVDFGSSCWASSFPYDTDDVEHQHDRQSKAVHVMSLIVWQNHSDVLGKEETLRCSGSVSVTTDGEKLYETFEHGRQMTEGAD